MLFEPTHYGHAISEQLSDYLREHTNQKERTEVAGKFSYGFATLDSIVCRKRSVTADNAPMIIELAKVAVQNRNDKNRKFEPTHRKLLKQIA